jgi:serine/threonine protein kinase
LFPEEDVLLGRLIAGKLLVKEVLGRGAMGVVYRAHHQTLEQDVAVKVMHPDLAPDRHAIVRFQQEAKAAARLAHPSSVQILDFGADYDGLLYLAMELLVGRTLLEVIEEESPLARERIVHIAAQVLSALAVAHDLGILHRDLKPENIVILDGDVVKVCDFGVAKLVEESGIVHATLTGALIGTPEYMSPEQCTGDTLDARSDLYSMGVILFHMLTRNVPFYESSAVATILKHIHAEPPDPQRLAPKADPRLCRICLEALRKQPSERYPNARAMLADIRGEVTGGITP